MKRALILMMCFLISFLMISCGAGSNEQNTDSQTERKVIDFDNAEDGIDDVVINEQDAINLMDEINAGLGILLPHEEGFPNYPESYGGSFFNGQQLCVCLADNTRENRDLYRNLVSIPGALRFKEVHDPYNYLYQLMMKISDGDQGSETTSVSVNEKNNCVDIGIPADEYDTVKESISEGLGSDELQSVEFVIEAPADISASDIDNPYPEVELTQEEIDFIWTLENLEFEEHFGSSRTIIYTCSDESKGAPSRIAFFFTYGKKYMLEGWSSNPGFWSGDFEIEEGKVILKPSPDEATFDTDNSEERIVFDIVEGNKLSFDREASSDGVEYELVLVGPGASAPDINGMLFEPDAKESLGYNFGFERFE